MKVDKDTCLFNLLTRVGREGMKVDKDTCLFNLLTRVGRERGNGGEWGGKE